MNKLEREQEKLDLRLCKDLLLLPASLVITDLPSEAHNSPHMAQLELNYAMAKVNVLVTFSKPMDFQVSVLQIDNLPADKKIPA